MPDLFPFIKNHDNFCFYCYFREIYFHKYTTINYLSNVWHLGGFWCFAILECCSKHLCTYLSFFFSCLLLFTFTFVVGLYYCFSNLSDARIFIIMYGVTSMYFSAVMVRNACNLFLPCVAEFRKYWNHTDASLWAFEGLSCKAAHCC